MGNCPENFVRKHVSDRKTPAKRHLWLDGVFRRNRNPEEDLSGSFHSLGKGAKDFQSLRNQQIIPSFPLDRVLSSFESEKTSSSCPRGKGGCRGNQALCQPPEQSSVLSSHVLARLPLPSVWLWGQCGLFNYMPSVTVPEWKSESSLLLWKEKQVSLIVKLPRPFWISRSVDFPSSQQLLKDAYLKRVYFLKVSPAPT